MNKPGAGRRVGQTLAPRSANDISSRLVELRERSGKTFKQLEKLSGWTGASIAHAERRLPESLVCINDLLAVYGQKLSIIAIEESHCWEIDFDPAENSYIRNRVIEYLENESLPAMLRVKRFGKRMNG